MESAGGVENMKELDRDDKDGQGEDIPIPYLVHMVVNYPCRVMCLSMGISIILVLTLLGCMSSGVINFELDTNPDSFNVKFDDMADRHDAFQAIRYSGETTEKSPLKSEPDRIDNDNNSTHSFEPWEMVQLGYEARNGKPHDPEGNAGGNIFDEDHLSEILAFEEELVKLEGYTDFCAKKDYDYSKPCEGFFFTPKLIAHAEELNMAQQVYGCCDCYGNSTLDSTPANKVCATKSSMMSS